MTPKDAASLLDLDEATVDFLISEFEVPVEGETVTENGMRMLKALKYLLFDEGYTLLGAKRILPAFLKKLEDPEGAASLLERKLEKYVQVTRESRALVEELLSMLPAD